MPWKWPIREGNIYISSNEIIFTSIVSTTAPNIDIIRHVGLEQVLYIHSDLKFEARQETLQSSNSFHTASQGNI